ncbi:MAG TPA: CoA transferase [Stellaceae bacterium]|nr:CoA transferase [Stellaceae bacterium]
MSGLALQEVRVIDLSAYLSGPYCSMILADHGADVIKIERPGEGDEARRMPPFINGESAPFMLWNRNKRSVTLDLKAPHDHALCLDLAREADVFIENFKPGVAQRLGLGYDSLAALNPRLIYCSISGFGQTGPYRARGGFDLMVQAMSGIMSVNGPEDGPPHRVPMAIADIGAGMFAAIGILAALQARTRTGRGQHVDTALYDAAVSFGLYEAAHLFGTGKNPPRLGQAHRASAPYQAFRTSDGWITIGANTQALWIKFCEVIGKSELAQDPRFRDNAARVANRPALAALVQDALAARTTRDWMGRFESAGIPAGPVQSYAEVFADPQVIAREMISEIAHPSAAKAHTLGIPVKLSETPGALRRPAPRLGEHTEEVLEELRRGRNT